MTDPSEHRTVALTPLNAKRHPPGEACLRFMVANDYDPAMPVFRASVTPEFMLRSKALRPDVDNMVQLLLGPFGIVDPRPLADPFRVAELQVGDVVLDVEAEYE